MAGREFTTSQARGAVDGERKVRIQFNASILNKQVLRESALKSGTFAPDITDPLSNLDGRILTYRAERTRNELNLPKEAENSPQWSWQLAAVGRRCMGAIPRCPPTKANQLRGTTLYTAASIREYIDQTAAGSSWNMACLARVEVSLWEEPTFDYIWSAYGFDTYSLGDKKIIWLSNGIVQPSTEDAPVTSGRKETQIPLVVSLVA
ncbi:hypothetical protein DFP72DRAFT_850989 [Ephemerocybe angulata]|uniref:Uncharacterized protein n=1 Tax=Ephemerocybe angulata TaxID=980116 RepID=A0A8H6M315_9AGAR|nr:hypothetical protein DFP72DRAFT_850989 [Tulosesus angulatus]